MRKIKFRAWSKLEKAFVPLVFNASFEENGTVNCMPLLELSQYTGLKDKNGVEIYEGDIIQIHNPSFFEFVQNKDGKVEWCEKKPISDPCVVIYENAMYWYKFENVGQAPLLHEHTEYYRGDRRNKIEVIGNIYENPELLEETK